VSDIPVRRGVTIETSVDSKPADRKRGNSAQMDLDSQHLVGRGGGPANAFGRFEKAHVKLLAII
jgi:hypothetical protein